MAHTHTRTQVFVDAMCETHGGTGGAELLQHVGDEDLEQSLTEETLPHRAAVIVKFLKERKKKINQ